MLNPEKVMQIVQLYTEEAWTHRRLAERFQVSHATISKVIQGLTWKHVTGGHNLSRYQKDTEFRCAYISARLEQGCRNYQTIADELGITRQGVSKLVKTKGLSGGNQCSVQRL